MKLPRQRQGRLDNVFMSREAARPTHILVRIGVTFDAEVHSSFRVGVLAFITAMNAGASAGAMLVVTDENQVHNTAGHSGTVELGIPVAVLSEVGGASLLSAIAGYYSTYAGIH